MPPNTEPEIQKRGKKSPRRKDKRRFEVSAEAGTTPGSEQVYEREKVAPPRIVIASAPVAQPAVEERASPSLLLDLVTLGFGTMGRALLAAASLLGAPLRITRRLFRL
jgi:hypothetical protein